MTTRKPIEQPSNPGGGSSGLPTSHERARAALEPASLGREAKRDPPLVSQAENASHAIGLVTLPTGTAWRQESGPRPVIRLAGTRREWARRHQGFVRRWAPDVIAAVILLAGALAAYQALLGP